LEYGDVSRDLPAEQVVTNLAAKVVEH